jgi:hypothetical protein
MSDDEPSAGFPVLAWLADVPLFIDRPRVASFYDAVLRPAARPVQLRIAASRMKQLEKNSGINLGISLPAWFPWLKLEAAAEAGGGATTSRPRSIFAAHSRTFSGIASVALHPCRNQSGQDHRAIALPYDSRLVASGCPARIRPGQHAAAGPATTKRALRASAAELLSTHAAVA